MIYLFSSVVIILLMILTIWKMIRSNYNIYNKLLVLNVFTTQMIVLILLIGSWSKIEHFINLSIAYGLLNFIATLVFFKFFKREND